MENYTLEGKQDYRCLRYNRLEIAAALDTFFFAPSTRTGQRDDKKNRYLRKTKYFKIRADI